MALRPDLAVFSGIRANGPAGLTYWLRHGNGKLKRAAASRIWEGGRVTDVGTFGRVGGFVERRGEGLLHTSLLVFGRGIGGQIGQAAVTLSLNIYFMKW